MIIVIPSSAKLPNGPEMSVDTTIIIKNTTHSARPGRKKVYSLLQERQFGVLRGGLMLVKGEPGDVDPAPIVDVGWCNKTTMISL